MGHVRKPIWPNPTFFFLLTSFLLWPWQKLPRKLPSPDSRATLPSRASHHPYKNAPPLLVPFSPSARPLPARSHDAPTIVVPARSRTEERPGAPDAPFLASGTPSTVTPPRRRPPHLAGAATSPEFFLCVTHGEIHEIPYCSFFTKLQS